MELRNPHLRVVVLRISNDDRCIKFLARLVHINYWINRSCYYDYWEILMLYRLRAQNECIHWIQYAFFRSLSWAVIMKRNKISSFALCEDTVKSTLTYVSLLFTTVVTWLLCTCVEKEQRTWHRGNPRRLQGVREIKPGHRSMCKLKPEGQSKLHEQNN